MSEVLHASHWEDPDIVRGLGFFFFFLLGEGGDWYNCVLRLRHSITVICRDLFTARGRETCLDCLGVVGG